jgi:hypothetical protein
MAVAATQPKPQRVSKRGRVNEGRPTKRTPELTAQIAESISFGLTDQEAAAIAGITPFTLSVWRRNPEFVDALRKATAIRLQNRLKTIESRADNWQPSDGSSSVSTIPGSLSPKSRLQSITRST